MPLNINLNFLSFMGLRMSITAAVYFNDGKSVCVFEGMYAQVLANEPNMEKHLDVYCREFVEYMRDCNLTYEMDGIIYFRDCPRLRIQFATMMKLFYLDECIAILDSKR